MPRANDAKSQWQPDSENHTRLDALHKEVTGGGYKHKYTASSGQGVMHHVYRKGGSENTRPTAIIVERKSGNHEVTYRPAAAKAKDGAAEAGEVCTYKDCPVRVPGIPHAHPKGTTVRNGVIIEPKSKEGSKATDISKEQKAARAESEKRMQASREEAQSALTSNRCPRCGNGVYVNNALPGWVQCHGYPSENFRKTGHENDPKCSWQGFTHDSAQARDVLRSAQHFDRAVQCELQHNRAKAADHYQQAANGFTRVGDSKRASDAAEGVRVCRRGFDAEFDHPGRGRVRVCDSAETALRTALERSRAGERVAVDGCTVRPASKATDAKEVFRVMQEYKDGINGWRESHGLMSYPDRKSADLRVRKETAKLSPEQKKKKRYVVSELTYAKDSQEFTDREAAEQRAARNARTTGVKFYVIRRERDGKTDFVVSRMSAPMAKGFYTESVHEPRTFTKDEHEGFKKLQGEIEHEGHSKENAGAIAASIGRKKYGAAGMAKKAAAGRAKDARVHKRSINLKVSPV